jgi:hypothetical protein
MRALARSELPGRVFGDADIDAGNAVAILGRPHDLRAEFFLQRELPPV